VYMDYGVKADWGVYACWLHYWRSKVH